MGKGQKIPVDRTLFERLKECNIRNYDLNNTEERLGIDFIEDYRVLCKKLKVETNEPNMEGFNLDDALSNGSKGYMARTEYKGYEIEASMLRHKP